MNLQDMIDAYQERIEQYNVAIREEKDVFDLAQKGGAPDLEKALLSSELKRLSDLRHLCVQVLKDLDSLN